MRASLRRCSSSRGQITTSQPDRPARRRERISQSWPRRPLGRTAGDVRFNQFGQFVERPDVIGDAGTQGGRHPQRHVPGDEVVDEEV
jgi:hypothetical protein